MEEGSRRRGEDVRPHNIVVGQRVSEGKVPLAQQMRREMTPMEAKLWRRLRGNGLGAHFRRQQVGVVMYQIKRFLREKQPRRPPTSPARRRLWSRRKVQVKPSLCHSLGVAHENPQKLLSPSQPALPLREGRRLRRGGFLMPGWVPALKPIGIGKEQPKYRKDSAVP